MNRTHTLGGIAGSALALALTLSGGCTTVENERLVLGPDNGPTTQRPAAIWPTEGIEPATSPSVTGASRDGWGEVTIVSVNDGVQHQENFTRVWPTFADQTPRARGEFPTPSSSVDTGDDTGAQVAEGFAWPIAIGSDIVMIIPRLIHQANDSPMGHYSRASEPVAYQPLAPQ